MILALKYGTGFEEQGYIHWHQSLCAIKQIKRLAHMHTIQSDI